MDDLDPAAAYFIDLDSAAAGPQQVRAGSFQASAGAAAIANSNLFVTPGDATAAVGIDVTPQASFRSEGPRSRLSGRLGARARLYADHSTENVAELDSEVDARVAVSRDLSFRASASAGRFVEDRAAAFAPIDVREPVEYDRFRGMGSVQYAPGRLVLAASAGLDLHDYHDEPRRSDPTQISDQSRRSLFHLAPSLIAGYRSPGGMLAYVGVEGDWREYDEDPARDSDGFRIYGGIRVRPHKLFGATLELGYQEQNYLPPLTSPSGLLARVEIEYVPDPLTRIAASARRDISETGALNLGGATEHSVELTFERTLSRAWAATVQLEATRSEASGGTVREDRITALLETRYIVAPRQELFVRLEPLIGSTSGPLATAPDFERIVALAGIRLRLQ